VLDIAVRSSPQFGNDADPAADGSSVLALVALIRRGRVAIAAKSSQRACPCFPGADYESWGAPFGHCDGAGLGFDDGRFVSVQSAGRRRSRCRGTKAGRR
jgi:hypothetical protein